MKILIASDHAGFELKEKIKKHYVSKFDWQDFGTYSNESIDYPDFAHQLASEISSSDSLFGILICGTGNGMAITANRHKNVRAALSWNVEIATLARKHNNANILVLPARFIEEKTAFDIIDVFFSTDFEGGRHQKRIDKINIQ